MKIKKIAYALGLAVTAVTVLTACGGGDDGVDDRLGIAEPVIRVVHAIPVGPNVDVYKNGAISDLTNLPYKTVTRYSDSNDTLQRYAINAAGTSTQLATTEIDAKTGHRYTVVALPGAAGAELLTIDDPYGKGIFSDKARVRALNASFNAQNIDMYITEPAADLNTATPTLAAVGYKAAVPASGQDSIDVKGGTYRLRITTAGTKTVIFDSGSLKIDDNADWLITAIPTDSIAAVLPNNIKVLVARANESDNATAVELVTQTAAQ